jgi:hypothetical protein
VSGSPTDLGPVQLLVIAYDDGNFDGRILDELRRLREEGATHLLDLLFLARDGSGEVVELERSDLSAAEQATFGALVRSLTDLGEDGEARALGFARAGAAAQNGSQLDPADVWFLADAIPLDTMAAVALIEHRWAIPLRDAIDSAGGHDLVDRWIHRQDLAAIGAVEG